MKFSDTGWLTLSPLAKGRLEVAAGVRNECQREQGLTQPTAYGHAGAMAASPRAAYLLINHASEFFWS